MGAGASVSIQDELKKPLDASDVATPRGETAKAEVVRLRALLAEKAKNMEVGPETSAADSSPSKQLTPGTYLSANAVLKQIHSKEKSCVDIVTESLQRIEDTKIINACSPNNDGINPYTPIYTTAC